MGSRVKIVVGLGFGDEGKGTSCAYLARETQAHTVIRFNGGGQAAHTVIEDDGRRHTFAQFGSGTFNGARTHLSRFMLVNPTTLINEEKALREIGVTDAYERMTIDGDALVTTHWHMMANRWREEARGEAKHGTCGMGIGETAACFEAHPDSAIRVRDLGNPKLLDAKLDVLRQNYIAQFSAAEHYREPHVQHWIDLASKLRIVDGEETRKILERDGTVIFEGAQGVLLDQDFGFAPHNTWTKTTFENAETLIAEALPNVSSVRRIGVLRSYMTRHGAGPMVTESGLKFPEPHNGDDGFQGKFRTGELDFPALTYAIRCVAGVDEIAVTHMDRIPEHVCLNYTTAFRPDASYLATCRPVYHRLRFHNDAELLDIIQSELGAPVTLTSWGPKTGDKRKRSQWT